MRCILCFIYANQCFRAFNYYILEIYMCLYCWTWLNIGRIFFFQWRPESYSTSLTWTFGIYYIGFFFFEMEAKTQPLH
jgi:hypothetical protein